MNDITSHADKPLALSSVNNSSLKPGSIGELINLATLLAKSSIIPKQYIGKVGDIFAIIYKGQLLGLDPFQAMEGIYSVNGKSALESDTMKALVFSSGVCTHFELIPLKNEGGEVEGFQCTVGRKGWPNHTEIFTKKMATEMKLWNSTPVWQRYPHRMMTHKVTGYALKALFSDILHGCVPYLGEEEGATVSETLTPPKEAAQDAGDMLLADYGITEEILVPDESSNVPPEATLESVEAGVAK